MYGVHALDIVLGHELVLMIRERLCVIPAHAGRNSPEHDSIKLYIRTKKKAIALAHAPRSLSCRCILEILPQHRS